MDHPNGVTGIAGLTVVADPEDTAGVVDWFERIHAAKAERLDPRTLRIATARGGWTVTDRAGFIARHGTIPNMLADATLPSVAAIDLVTARPADVAEKAAAAGLEAHWIDDALVLPQADRLGGVVLRFGRFGT